MTHDDVAGHPAAGPDGPVGSFALAGSDLAGRRAEGDDLDASVAAVSRLAASRLGFKELLTEVATLAVQALPGADGAGLTLLEEGRSNTIVTTADFIRQVEDVQYSLGEGPCISAAEQAQTMLSASLGGDLRWPRFGGRVARLGVHSAVSMPLITPEGVIGAVNVYAHAKHAFNSHAAQIAELFAVPAAVAVQNAQVIDQTRRTVARLEHEMQTHGPVERAVGIIMSRAGITSEEALDRLRRLSQTEHRKLTAVARSIVDEAVARALRQSRDK